MPNDTSRRTLLVFATLIGLLTNSSTNAQPGTSSTLPQVADLFLGNWAGTSTTASGENVASELTFRWTLDRNFLEVRNSVTSEGKLELFALTVYGWQPVLGKLVFWAFDKDGTINEGVAELETEALNHQWRSFSKAGEIRDWTSTLERIGKGRIAFTVFDRGGAELFSLEYKKKGQTK